MKNKLHGIDLFLIIVSLLCLAAALCPASLYKSAGDTLASDGELERLTLPLISGLRIAAGAVCVFCLALVFWQLRFPESRSRFFRSLLGLPGRCIRDIKPFFRDLGRAAFPRSWQLPVFLLIFTAGIAVRWLQLSTPLMHDEAYSMALWARSDALFAISDYHLPNNHVFNSLLMNIVYHTLGKTPAMLRLPVFISGILLIPAVWLLGKSLYNDLIALLAVGLTAFGPFLISYSFNARGYEIQAFLTILTFGLAVYGRRTKNIFSWFLLILLSALNFFTLPIALYPFGGICVWLFLNVLFFDGENSKFNGRGELFKYLIFCGLSVVVLTFVLYTPLLRYSGWNSLFGNIYIGGTEASTFGQTMAARLTDNVKAFTEGLPSAVICLTAAGLAASPFLFRKNSREKISCGASLLLWMALLIPFQRPNLWPRTLLFLHPLLLLFAASGIFGLSLLPHGRKIFAAVSVLLIIGAGVSLFIPAAGVHGIIGPDERSVQRILEREGENAVNIHYVTAAQDNAPLWVYADAYGLPAKIFDKREAFNTVYALVNPLNDAYLGPKDLDDLLTRFGPGGNFVNMDSAEILMEEPDAILYRFETYESAIRKSYGIYPGQ